MDREERRGMERRRATSGSIRSFLGNCSIRVWALASDEWWRVPHEWSQTPNTNVVSGPCVLGEILNELVVTIKGGRVRPSTAPKKAVLNQYRPNVSENFPNGVKFLWGRDLLTVACPLVDIDSTPFFEL